MSQYVRKIIDAIIKGQVEILYNHIPYFGHVDDSIWPYRF